MKAVEKAAVEMDDAQLAKLAGALGHPARVAILRFLAREGVCICGEIVAVLPLAQSTVSQHLKVLKEAGWIKGETEGPRSCYCVNPQAIENFGELWKGFLGESATSLKVCEGCE